MYSGNVTIEAIAYELAPHRISSQSLEEQIAPTMERINVSPGQLEAMTGIRERGFWDPDTQPSTVATRAAQKLLDQVNINPDEIGVLINASLSKDYVEPSVACFVHNNLHLSPGCLNFDIANACLGFLNAMDIAAMMIEQGRIKYGLVVAGESSREVVESTIRHLQKPDTNLKTYRDNFATLTLGSGAVAMLLGHRNHSRTGHTLNGLVNQADTQYNHLCLGHHDQMITNGMVLLMAGRALAERTWKVASQILPNWHDEHIGLYAPHQVGARHMQVINEALGITPAKVHLNLHTQGNIGPAALPITLAMADEVGRTHQGQHVALLGIGSGLNCSMMSVTW